MRKTAVDNTLLLDSAICISRSELPQLLGCGQATAEKIARAAGARIKIGKRVLIKVDKVNDYLNSLSE